MKTTDMLALLREFYRDKLAMRNGHVSAAKHVTHYDFNNTYQYVIAREDMHTRWVSDAVAELGGQTDETAPSDLHPSGKEAEAQRTVITSDRDTAQAFLDKWRSRVEALPNARHRILLQVILGETAEHKRFFDQALGGRTDLLGRRADGAGTGGGVLAARWAGGEKT